jgi:type II secretory pathway pseudopilin PulG
MLAIERKGEIGYGWVSDPAMQKPKSAFTLVELLLFIAIMGILAVLLLAAVAQTKARAQRI